ncbi:PadR family transcriptional regulator [Agromyces atrinae]|uniref:PadR family transcriptional regulator n=1 Tax=Agromyces atrinae TaxID=592376 RepID=A0A4Q2ME03_9MICO|nr:PadR family transcriptional regulator [Agromyces atrinae]NYD67464.1 DNA-binding PadR family transcriptional regulator [Agromyces atrinae]RXZ88312.1 PadR family transcriptional regulator [Agromyces atrinae]
MASTLTPPSFWILTALAGQRRHGYEILQETAQSSDGRVTLKVTTLYAALERLEREGLIEADGDEIVNGRARRYFRLTDDGSAALAAEIAALEEQTTVARARLSAAGHVFASRAAVWA